MIPGGVFSDWLLIIEVAVLVFLLYKVLDLSAAAAAEWWTARGEDLSANKERER